MPNVTAFQKADRLALLIAIDSFFALLECRTMSEDASRVAFKIRRCQYENRPADVKTLMSFLGFSKTKVLNHLKELEEHGFEFRTIKDPLDNRRSVQVLHGTEMPETTEFFVRCLKVVDDLVEAREKAKAVKEPSPLAVVVSKAARATRLLPIAAAGWLAAWMVFDTDKVHDIDRWSTEVRQLIEEPIEHFWDHYHDIRHDDHHHDLKDDHRARDTSVRFA